MDQGPPIPAQNQNLNQEDLQRNLEQQIINNKYFMPVITGATYLLIHPFANMQIYAESKAYHPFLLANNLKFRSVFDFYKYFNTRDRGSRMWRGLFPGMVWSMGLAYKLRFSNNLAQDPKVVPGKDEPKTLKNAFKVFLAELRVRVIFELALYPLEVILVKVVSDLEPISKHSGVVDCITSTLKEEGFQGLYRGIPFKIAHVLFESAFSALGYTLGFNLMNDLDSENKSLNQSLFQLGQLLIGYPLEVQRTRTIVGCKPDVEILGGRIGLYTGDVYAGLIFDVVPKLIDIGIQFIKRGN